MQPHASASPTGDSTAKPIRTALTRRATLHRAAHGPAADWCPKTGSTSTFGLGARTSGRRIRLQVEQPLIGEEGVGQAFTLLQFGELSHVLEVRCPIYVQVFLCGAAEHGGRSHHCSVGWTMGSE